MERMEFSDNMTLYDVNNDGKSKKGGCYVSTAVGFLLLLLTIAIAVGVGLIVHFAGNSKQLICNCPSVNGGQTGAQTMKNECKKMAAAGDAEICNSCPASGSTPTTQPTVTTSTPTTKVKDVRIPMALYPMYTDVELRPNIYDGPAKDFTFDGYARIQLRCDTPTNNVTLHMNKLIINNSSLEFGAESGTATAPSIVRWDFDKDRQFMVIHLDGMLIKNRLYYVKMNYTSPLKPSLDGLYLSSYKRNNKTVYIATTQFQPVAARKVFPCFDEPAIKSNFNITLVRKNHMKSISNMPIARTDNRGNNWVADVFETSPMMPTYLLAFIVCDFEYTSVTMKNDVLFRTWSRPASLSQTAYSLDVGPKLLTHFEDYFEIRYPLPKQDMIAVPDFSAGAMENWGLIVYRETAMLYEPGVSTEKNKDAVATTVAHELAHQWFGNLVSPSWWDDLWLNEGFATFEMYSSVDAIYPDWKMWEQFAIIHQRVFNFDGLISSHPVYVPVGHPDEINEIFDQISYFKGGAIIRMMRFFLGEETFRMGLSKYLKKLSYGAAFHDDLWQSMTEQSTTDGKNINVKEVMDTWTLQMNYPVVMVTRVGNSRVRVTQQRYLRDSAAADPGIYTSDFGYKWEIPFAFTSSKERKFNKTDADITWIHKTVTHLEIDSPPTVPDQSDSDSWILGNPMQYGFYRVNYDTQNWNALIKQLQTDHTVISPINRAQIMNDAWNLAKAGMLSLNIALQTIEYLDKEMNDVPWKAANAELGYVRNMLANTGVYGNFQAVMRAKVESTFKKVGMDNTGATHTQSYLRAEIVSTACRYEVQGCIDESLRLFRAWMKNPTVNPINPDLRSSVYCAALRHGGVAEWDFAFEQYVQATVAAESEVLLATMSCASKPWILTRYLERAMAQVQIRKQDAPYVFRYVSRNPIAQGLVWDFFRARWDGISKDFASLFGFNQVVADVTGSLNTQFDLDQLKDFMANNPDQGAGKRAFQQAVEKTQANIKWMDNNLEAMKTWLKKQTDAITPTPTPTPEPKAIDVRLPMALYPLKYDIELRPNIYEGAAKDFTFNGYVRIQLRCDTPTNNVTLHTNDLTINNSSLEFGAEPGTATAPPIVRWEWDKDRQFMVVHIDGMLIQGGLYYVKMNYTGPLKDDLAGLYLSSYKRDNKTVYLATTQFQPTDARKAFPCFDEPAVKSVFNVILVRKANMLSLSNMPKVRSEDRGGNWVADVFDVSPKMPVYLLAFVVCDYTYVEKTTTNNVKFRVWSRPASINQTAYALDTGVKLTTYFESFFGIRYPLPKQDMIAVPDFVARAMENWGLIVYRENVMLFKPGVSTERNKAVAAYLVSHEIAHQWFGNLVTPSWWDDLWLNEGFATFEGYMGVDFVHPDWKTWEQFALIMHNAFSFDGLVSSHPVYVPVGHPDQIFEIFDSISYEKGASVIRMMKFFLGGTTYQTGLSNYLRSKAYSDAFHDDLWQAMTDQAGREGKNINVKEIMDPWTLQMNYPVVMVTRQGPTRIKVTQQRYLQDPNAADPGKYTSDFGYKWDIPFTFTSSKEKDFVKTYVDIKWMNKTTSELIVDSPTVVPDQSDSNSWVLGNPMQDGYYRVNYDTQNWQALINQLKTDPKMVHPVNRAQVINDAWNLAKAGMLSQDIALQTVEYLDKEMDYVPWKAANRELDYVNSMLSKTGVFGGFKAFMKSKVEGVFKKLGMDNTGATHLESYMRSEIADTACNYGVKSCVDESLKLYRQWMNNAAVNPINPDLKSTVYCTAIRSGGVAEWDFAFKQYETATVAAETVLLLTAMGCSSEPWILSRYLERALTPSQIRKQDALDVFVYVSGNPIGQSLAWDYLVAKWDLIFSDYSGSFFAFRRMIAGTTSTFNTQLELNQLKNFINTHPNLGSGTRSFQQAVEKTQSNIKWMENNVETIKTWLKKQADTTTTTPEPKAIDVRLPMALYPLKYDIELRPNIYEGAAKNFTFNGYVRIQLRCDTPANNVTLHTNDLMIDDSSLEFGAEPGTPTAPSIVRWEWDKDRQFMVIHLDRMLIKNGFYYVKMNYTGPLKDDLAGMYLSSYKRDNKTVYLATTQFQPTDARKAFPCFDEPAIKSIFNVILVRKNHMISLSNMPLARSENRGDNWVADVYDVTPKMPVYLLAFVVCDFTSMETTTANNLKFSVWSRPASINQTAYALDTGVKLTTYFESYFNISYPLPKQDMIAVPDFVARAMENWGLIVYRENVMLFQPGVSTERNKAVAAYLVSHELAHQWFGNLVTPSWWDDLWLNEGFATFEGYMGVDFAHPDWKTWEQFALIMHNALNFDGLVSSHPVYVPVGHPDQIFEIFDSISYEKGASVIRMMKFFLGETTYQKGLSNYLRSKAYSDAFHDDLWQAMTDQAAREGKNINVKAIMDTWTLQMNYPVVFITRQGATQIKVTQQRYLRDPNAADPGKYTSDFGYKWDIPLTFTSSKEKDFMKTYVDISWMSKNSTEMTITSPSIVPDQSDSNSWILGNPMQDGYYRVNYDTQNWQALINQLKTDPKMIHPVNRAQIINDAWNLAKAGMLSQDIALQTVEYLDKEMDYVPWKAANRELDYVKTMLSKTGVFGGFEAFMKSKVEGIFKKLGMDNTGATHLESYMRSEIAGVACNYGVKSCVDESLKLYRQWMDNAAVNPINPDLKSTVYCTAIRNGGAAEWDFAFKQYETATVAAETVLLLAAMGCSSEPWILSRYLERALTPSQIRKQDALDVFVYVSGNPIGQGLAWDYLVAKWDLIFSDYSGSFFAFRRMIEGTTSTFNTQLELNQLNNFINTHPNLGSGTRSFQQAVEKTQANIKWMENNVETIKMWLKKQADTTTTTPETKVIDVRLPMALYPLKYDIELRPNIYEGAAKDFTFNGYVRIQLRCDTPTNNVTLHTNDLTINNSSLEVGAEPGTPTAPSIVRWEWDKDRQFMVIHLDGMLIKDRLYYVKMNYTGPLKDDLAGMYLSSYKRDNKTVYLATTQFQPTDARKAFPCFDEPAIKSVFNVVLVRKTHMISLSNMRSVRSEDRGDNWIADVYEISPKMPVYLLAFVVCDYTYVETTTTNNIKFRVWSRPASINQTTYALDTGVKLMDYFESYFNITYPLPKQDMIAVPDFVARAMENWGLIVYRENVMLFQPGVSTERNRDVAAYLVSHEIAHQWFGNLVTPSWWDDLWLNEGFATFEGYMGVDYVHPDWKIWEQFALVMHNAYSFDGLVSSHPVYVPVGHPDQIFEIFDSISYEKGASVIRMMKFFLGDTTYQTGLTNYLRSNAYSDAFHDDLWQAMTDQAARDGKDIDVKAIMDTWTLQMNYPVVMVTRHSATQIRVTQQRYLQDPNAVDPGKYTSDFGYKWDIPLTFTSSKEKDFTKTYADISWMSKDLPQFIVESPTVVPDQSDNNSWILGNPMQYGYYRVNYDTQNWQALINQLKTDHKMIHPINRAQIINDAWNLAKAGMLSQDIALQTVEYLDKEMDYVPWKAANRELDYVKSMLSKTGAFGGFEAFMKSKVEGIFKKLGMNNTGATHLESYMRSEIAGLACTYGVKSCVDKSLELYRQWMKNAAVNPINPDLKSTVYCTAIRNGGVAEWDFAFKQYETATVAAETVLLLTAMGCSREPWILSRYLERALTPSQIRKQDALDVFVYVSGNPIGQSLAWDYVVAKWDLIFSDYSGSFFAFRRLIEGTTSTFNTPLALKQLKDFIDAHPNLGSGTRAFQQAVEKTQANIKWMQNNVETMKLWLKNQATSTTTKAKVTDVRIPMALYPLYFDVELRPNMYEGPASNFTFDGYVRIQLRCDTPANNVTLHMNRLIINNSTLEFGAEPGTATAPSIVRWDWDKDRQFMVIHLDGMLVKDGLYYIKMNYTSPLKAEFAGLYLASYKRDNKTIYVATTQFQPTDARKAFPCFDEPAIKSYFNITLVRKNHMKSLSNMPIVRTESRGDNWVADVFETSPKMPVYLLAFVVCDYLYTEETTKNNAVFRAWSRPASINQTTYALDVGVKVLDYYEEYFDIAFPLPKQDMIAVPAFVATAMENWGLIIYRESTMLFQPGVSTERNKAEVAYVVSHELAHQWFGNLVSPSWWDDLWLNEGFATFEGYMGVDFVQPDWKIWEQFALIVQNAFNFDGLVSSHPVYVPVGHPNEIYEIFDSISYEKGAAVIRMMRFFLGPQTFQTGLSNYLKKKAYDAAFHDDLWQSMTEQASVDGKNIAVKDIMDTWTLQMNYPVVMVKRTGTRRIMLTQHRYLTDPNAPDPKKYTSDFDYKWAIPFTFTSSTEKKFNKTNVDITWMQRNNTQVEIDSPEIPDPATDSNSWFLGNPLMTCYYRVNYETENWKALINQLKTDPNVIDPINRAQIVNDAWNLAKAGMLSQDIALSSVEYLDKEMDYVPWRAALIELAYVRTMLSKTGIFGGFEAFMTNKVEGVFNTLGMNNTGASHLETFLRAQVVEAACEYRVQRCIDESLRLYREWMGNEANNRIDVDLRGTVYCTAIRNGGVKEWDFAFKQYEITTVAADSDLLLKAMGCSREPWIISRYLERALTSSQINKQDALDVFVHVSGNPIGQSLAWDYLVTKWDLIFNDFASSFFAFIRLITATTSPFNTAMELNQLQNFIATHPNLGTGARAFQQGVEKTQANIKWMENNMAAVKTWLTNQGLYSE